MTADERAAQKHVNVDAGQCAEGKRLDIEFEKMHGINPKCLLLLQGTLSINRDEKALLVRGRTIGCSNVPEWFAAEFEEKPTTAGKGEKEGN